MAWGRKSRRHFAAVAFLPLLTAAPACAQAPGIGAYPPGSEPSAPSVGAYPPAAGRLPGTDPLPECRPGQSGCPTVLPDANAAAAARLQERKERLREGQAIEEMRRHQERQQ